MELPLTGEAYSSPVSTLICSSLRDPAANERVGYVNTQAGSNRAFLYIFSNHPLFPRLFRS